MLTLKQVNAAIAAKGIKAELVKGAGYYWFFGDDVEYAVEGTSVYVYRLNDQSLQGWMDDLDRILADHNSHKPDQEALDAVAGKPIRI